MEASDKKVKKERPKSQQKKKRDEEEIREISIAVLGAVNVGKSAFINQYYYKRFLEEYQPTISHSFSKTVDWDSESFFLTIDDTSGNIDYQKERDRSIKKAEGFIIVYDITSSKSLEHATQIMEHLPKVKKCNKKKTDIPLAIVGTKLDVVEGDPSLREVNMEHLTSLSKQNSVAILELSNKDRTMVVKVVDTLLREILRLEAEKDPNKNLEKKKKKNLLERFFQRRPSKMELVEKKILKSEGDEALEPNNNSTKKANVKRHFTLSSKWFGKDATRKKTSGSNLTTNEGEHQPLSTSTSSSSFESYSKTNFKELEDLDLKGSDTWTPSARTSRAQTFSTFIATPPLPMMNEELIAEQKKLHRRTAYPASPPPRPKRPYPPASSSSDKQMDEGMNGENSQNIPTPQEQPKDNNDNNLRRPLPATPSRNTKHRRSASWSSPLEFSLLQDSNAKMYTPPPRPARPPPPKVPLRTPAPFSSPQQPRRPPEYRPPPVPLKKTMQSSPSVSSSSKSLTGTNQQSHFSKSSNVQNKTRSKVDGTDKQQIQDPFSVLEQLLDEVSGSVNTTRAP